MSSQETLVPKRRGPKPKGAVGLNVRVPMDLMAAIDAWIAERADTIPPETLTRPEAVRRLAAEALIGMGLLPVPGDGREEAGLG